MRDETSAPQPTTSTAPARDPWGSVLASFLWCGAGQFHNGNWIKGLLLFPVSLLFYMFTFFLAISGPAISDSGGGGQSPSTYATILITLAPRWTFSLAEAYRTAAGPSEPGTTKAACAVAAGGAAFTGWLAYLALK